MERLTTNKNALEMNMIELAHNSCYVKDNKARYRDYETDIDARELTIKLLNQYTDIPNEFTCDADFDEFMFDSLQYGADDMLGLISVFYRNLLAMAVLRERLKDYEDLEEQGKLLKLPCAVGDKYFTVEPAFVHDFEKCQKCEFFKKGNNENEDDCCFDYSNRKLPDCLMLVKKEFTSVKRIVSCMENDFFGKTVFLTKEEAEAALQAMNKPG